MTQKSSQKRTWQILVKHVLEPEIRNHDVGGVEVLGSCCLYGRQSNIISYEEPPVSLWPELSVESDTFTVFTQQREVK